MSNAQLKFPMERFEKKNDIELIKLVKAGEMNAFTEIVNRHKPVIAATVYGLLGDCAEAEDVGQETFIRFYKSIGNFKGDSALSTYLVRIAINLSLNELKKRKRKYKMFVHKEDEKLVAVTDDDDPVENRATSENIDAALQMLDESFRQVVVLRLIQGYSVKETADILDIPVGTVLSRLSRAQKKLRKILKPIEKESIER